MMVGYWITSLDLDHQQSESYSSLKCKTKKLIPT